MFVIVVHSNVETHSITILEFVAGGGVLKETLVEADFHLPTAHHRLANAEHVVVGAVFPIHSRRPDRPTARDVVGWIPGRKTALVIDVTVSADRIFGVVSVVVQAVRQG